MAVKIVIDSASDITRQQAQELGLIHLPLKVIFGQEEYEDTVNLSHEEFFEKLIETDELPTTCQIPPAAFDQAFREITEAGDTAVALTISSKLSGTYQSAVIAAQDYPGKVFVVDTMNACIGERILALHALDLAKEGCSASEIVEALEAKKGKVRVLALLDTLEYLKKGGRISKATALAGSLLSIKPVIAVENGEVAMLGKARGSKQGNNLLRELVNKCGGINFDLPYCLAYSGLSDALLQKYIADSASLWQGRTEHLPISTIGSTIGTHVGPGAVAVAFFEN